MYENIIQVMQKYNDVIIPAVEQGNVTMSEQLIESFLKIASMLYQSIQYDGTEDENSLRVKMYEFYNNGNVAGIIGMMNSFFLFTNAALNLQMQLNNQSYDKYEIQSRMAYCANNERIRCYEQIHGKLEGGHFTGKGVVYSAITGGYDDINDPTYVDEGLDYILFTDNPNIRSDVWKIVLIENEEGLDNVRLARKIKILGYKLLSDYDYSVWVDGKIVIKNSITDYINQYGGSCPILCFNHYSNNCVYEEYELCGKMKKDSIDVMRKQIDRYRQEGYPENHGMVDSCVLVRELHDDKLNQVMDTWWNEVRNESFRDQLSFNYSFWKNDFVYDTVPLFVYMNDYFTTRDHL